MNSPGPLSFSDLAALSQSDNAFPSDAFSAMASPAPTMAAPPQSRPPSQSQSQPQLQVVGAKRKRAPQRPSRHSARDPAHTRPLLYTDNRRLLKRHHAAAAAAESAQFAVDPTLNNFDGHNGHGHYRGLPTSFPHTQPHDPSFTQGLDNCQQPGGACYTASDPFHCSWDDFAAPSCNVAAVPCSDPNCEDVSPCPATPGECTDPVQCLGNICYDQGCAPNGPDGDFWCNDHCDEATQCASPCFSDECNVPACDAPCLDSKAAFDASHSDSHTQPHLPPGHQMQGDQVLCQSQACDFPSYECVDPKCLSVEPHVHHDLSFLDELTTDVGNYHSAATTTPHLQDPFASAIDDSQSTTPMLHAHNHSAKGKDKHDPIEYILDFNKQTQSQHHRALSTSMSDASWLPLPELSNSLTATPKSTDTSELRTTISASPASALASALPHSYSCLWSADAHGMPCKPCGKIFNDASELHAHVERSHVDTLQREISGAVIQGYWCRWAGCNRNDTANPSVSFAARPKLKRHIQTHTLYKPFICDTCGVSMKTKDAMEKHLRTHTGERPYRCPIDSCAKIFATSTELKTHMVVHSGKKPHECPLCGESFADSSNLSKHKKTHFLGMYRCPAPGCGARMKRWDQMRRHIVSQGHARNLLDDADAQREYKTRMEREWREVPEEEKLLNNVKTI